MSVGFSEYTALKEEYYSKIMGYQMDVSLKVINKWKRFNRNYLLIDATAGSGIVHQITGSPLLALDKLKEFENWNAVLIEENRRTFKQLVSEIDQRYPARDHRLQLENKCYGEYLKQLQPDAWQIGLLYVDENGVPDFNVIRAFAQRMPRMDILVSVAATSIKRKNGLFSLFAQKADSIMRLEELTRLKKITLIREPYGAFQWTFIFASNGLPFDKAYAGVRLYPVDTPIGRSYLDRANHTEKERNEFIQATLPDL